MDEAVADEAVAAGTPDAAAPAGPPVVSPPVVPVVFPPAQAVTPTMVIANIADLGFRKRAIGAGYLRPARTTPHTPHPLGVILQFLAAIRRDQAISLSDLAETRRPCR